MAPVHRSLLFFATVLLLWLAFPQGTDAISHRRDCPGGGYDNHGYWSVDEKDGARCVLKCDSDYEPSDCHVLRRKGDGWNYPVPHCKETPVVSSQTTNVLMAAGVGAVAIAAAPAALAAAGFTAAGVAAGSIAAFLQTPFTAAGSWFAASQSAGVVGLATATKVAVGTAAAGTTYLAASGQTCESE